MTERNKIEEPVTGEFARFNEEFESSLRSGTGLLQAAIDQILGATGKHIRPLLVLLSAKACGTITESTINSAVFLELLHTATLIHDDVIDETKQRRGVWGATFRREKSSRWKRLMRVSWMRIVICR